MKILIADDDRMLAHLISARLRSTGWTVDIAYDAMQVLMMAMRSAPDIIVLDIAMPGGTGVDALRKLKQSVRTAQIPVVVLSGSIEPGEEQNVLALGAVAFIRKPPDIEALDERLRQLIGAPRREPAP